MSESGFSDPTPASKPSRFSSIPMWVWLLLAMFAGAIVGLGTYTFAFAEGASYFSNDADACVNCHIMRDVYDGWNHGSHESVAVCNDCHTPHTFPAKYVVKGINGLKHSVAFTTGSFPEPIQITDLNRDVAQGNCLYCHESMVSGISHESGTDPTDCLRCHDRVGHDT